IFQMVKSKLLIHLQKLAGLQQHSPFLYVVARDLVLLAFSETKPLFADPDKAKAAELLRRTLPLLETSFASLHGSLNPDLRQTAQRCRSGLEFLIDEFREDQKTYSELKPVLSSAPVKCVEDYIKHTRGVPPEYSTLVPQDLTSIPPSHFWWYQDLSEEYDE
ncbi:hypothetical protein BgiMline_020902, partial [Biomphalaria glabrata]